MSMILRHCHNHGQPIFHFLRKSYLYVVAKLGRNDNTVTITVYTAQDVDSNE